MVSSNTAHPRSCTTLELVRNPTTHPERSRTCTLCVHGNSPRQRERELAHENVVHIGGVVRAACVGQLRTLNEQAQLSGAATTQCACQAVKHTCSSTHVRCVDGNAGAGMRTHPAPTRTHTPMH